MVEARDVEQPTEKQLAFYRRLAESPVFTNDDARLGHASVSGRSREVVAVLAL